MSREVFELAILISLKDAASGHANRVEAQLRSMGNTGKATLKTFEELRHNMRQGLAVAGAGVAGLTMLKGGIKSAGDFEAAMADLRMSIQEVGKGGRIDLAKLGDEMNRFEQLGIKLGNQLPGTTRDFIEMFSTLKQGGLDTRTILGGTGEAVAHLAVVTGNVPKDLAEPFAQYAQQFSLTGEEAVKLADVLAKLKFRTGLNPQELIEGSKFFQLRAGAPLGLTGLEGAEISGRVLATLRKSGLEGGIGGRELAGMFGKLTFDTKPQRAALAELKHLGIELQFFDKKGKFLGVENVFAQMEKLRGLSQQKRISIAKELFGEEAVGPASVMIKTGLAGWRDVNAEIDKGAVLQEMINQKTQTYNAKMESVLGTIENLKATVFTPLLDTLKPVLDTTNSIAGSLQGWAKEHQTVAGMVTHLFGVGSAALVVVGGFKSMRAAWALWKIVSAVGSGEGAMLDYLRKFRTGTEAAGIGAQTAATRVSGFCGAVSRIPSSVKVTVGLIGVEYAISRISDVIAAMRDLAEAQEGMASAASGGEKIESIARKTITDLRAAGKTKEADKLESTLPGPSSKAEQAMRALSNAGQLFGLGIGGWNLSGEAAKKFAPALGQADVMAEFLRKIRSGAGAAKDLDQNDRAVLEGNLRAAFPDSFKQAAEALERSLQKAEPQVNETTQAIQQLRDASQSAAGSLRSLADLKSPESAGPGRPTVAAPSRASGGLVQSQGFVYLHAGETIVPARVTPRFEPSESIASARSAAAVAGAGGAMTVHLHIHPAAGSAMANDPRAFAEQALDHITHKVRRQRERR